MLYRVLYQYNYVFIGSWAILNLLLGGEDKPQAIALDDEADTARLFESAGASSVLSEILNKVACKSKR
jgi:hypothetical protein